ncbi:hypothetical protein AA0Z99_10330 [Agrococcus sp. 1P02AA]|uniref:hypothetical protein n=1 Tax=Agrococcus sp. 1P02AA TaxID=3132259 RepID=UPI0039A51E63
MHARDHAAVTPPRQDEAERRHIAAALRERVYVSFTALAVTIATASHAHELTAGAAALTIGIAIGGIVLAAFVAELLAHLAVHQEPPARADLGRMVTATLGAATVVLVPLAALGLAGLDVWSVETALRVVAWLLIAWLAVVGWLGVRRMRVRLLVRVLLLAVLVLLGCAVIAVELLAHSL